MSEIKLVKRKTCCRKAYIEGYKAGINWSREMLDRQFDALAGEGEVNKISVKDVKHG